MSLVNDALKRARQLQAAPASAINTAAGLQPVTEPHARSGNNGLVLTISVVVLLAGVAFIWMWWRSAHGSGKPALARASIERTAAAPRKAEASQPTATSVSTSSIAPGANSGAVKSARAAVTNTLPVVAAGANIVTNISAGITQPIRAEPEAVTNQLAAQPVPVDPVMQTLKLQGIFFRTIRASALINGHTLFVGDEIDGAKVVSIDRQSVRLAIHGQTNTLNLH